MRKKLIFAVLVLLSVTLIIAPEGVWAKRSMVYFYTPSCGSCMQVRNFLSNVQEDFPDLEIMEFSTTGADMQVLLEKYGENFGVDEEHLGIVPAIFYGDQAMVGINQITTRLRELLQTPLETVKPKNLPGESGDEAIVERFKSFGGGTILLAGLVDGINPCAFSTLIFFISFLVVTGQTGRKILYVGASFTLGIFLSYLLMGWGLFKLVDTLQSLTKVARWVYPVTALLVSGLAVVSFLDYRKVVLGKRAKMNLILPRPIIRLINTVVQKLMKLRYLIPVSFITGVLISLLEFLCTGQIYLPTIVYMTGAAYLKARALTFLVLYNISFILPMVIIFIVAYKTNTSQKVSEYLNTRLKGIKLALTGVFTLLAVYMWVLTGKFF